MLLKCTYFNLVHFFCLRVLEDMASLQCISLKNFKNGKKA